MALQLSVDAAFWMRALGVNFVPPLLGLLLYLRLCKRMYAARITEPPTKILFLVFVTYGGWLMIVLTALFWMVSGMVTLGLAHLVMVAPIVMAVAAWLLRKRRKETNFHGVLFALCAAYPLVVFPFLLIARALIIPIQINK